MECVMRIYMSKQRSREMQFDSQSCPLELKGMGEEELNARTIELCEGCGLLKAEVLNRIWAV